MGSWFKNFKESFKVVIVHPETFEERGNFSLSKMSFFYHSGGIYSLYHSSHHRVDFLYAIA